MPPGSGLSPSRACRQSKRPPTCRSGRYQKYFVDAGELLLERADVGYERLDLVVLQLFSEWLHLLFAILLKSFLDGLEHFFVGQAGLIGGVRLVLDAGFFARLGLPLAVLAVTGGTMLAPQGLHVRRGSRQS